jgi:hypothetical protein
MSISLILQGESIPKCPVYSIHIYIYIYIPVEENVVISEISDIGGVEELAALSDPPAHLLPVLGAGRLALYLPL